MSADGFHNFQLSFCEEIQNKVYNLPVQIVKILSETYSGNLFWLYFTGSRLWLVVVPETSYDP